MNTTNKMPDAAFILAAGKGTRMRPLTDDLPKPMIEIDGRTMIDRAIDQCMQSGLKKIAVNLHYHGEVLEDHLKRRDDVDIIFSKEPELLDTGGGIKQAAKFLNEDVFFVLSGDSVWSDGSGQSALMHLAEAWDPDEMDMFFLLEPVKRMTLTKGVGDYHLKDGGRIERSHDQSGTHMFTSIRLMKSSLLDNAPDGSFSFLDIMDECEKAGRLFGVEHKGEWHHISTPDDVKAVNKAMGGS